MNPSIKNIPEIHRSSDSSNAPDGSTSSIVFFGLHLFVDSYKSFLLCDESTSKTLTFPGVTDKIRCMRLCCLNQMGARKTDKHLVL
ncbi:hypothetical protein HO173_006619 [Letharia columbiana]|uniref:Uncharacterized protein n=1 Tax=Letharia columbiana TaxID=112416 RepID=A0A8H6FVE3_9LECA|nr:uncharacterized protein HO173_006619 [Letharia columbiana]KAF6235423.1 hypothetical protein HO173_006619 [Letharia columbiana]